MPIDQLIADLQRLKEEGVSGDTEVNTGYMEVTEVFYNEKEDYVELN